MSIDERIEALKVRGREYKTSREFINALNADNAFKNEIISLYYAVYKKRVTGCSNCISDAYVELINTKKSNSMTTTVSNKFRLCAGVLLHDVRNFDASKQMSNININNDLAVYHLATNPSCIKYFDTMPTDWESQVAAFIEAEKTNTGNINTATTQAADAASPETEATETKAKATVTPKRKSTKK